MSSLVHRSSFVRDRLIELNQNAGDIVLENAYLCYEAKKNGYHREWGYQSFDEAIEDLHNKGLLDYGSRNARHFVAIAAMIEQRGYDPDTVKQIGISKLREIASIPMETEQRQLLEDAKTLSTSEVQRKAKVLRDKAHGRDTDPLHPITLMTSETQRTLFKDCIEKAREVYALNDDVPETAVLIDNILADWFTNAIEA